MLHLDNLKKMGEQLMRILLAFIIILIGCSPSPIASNMYLGEISSSLYAVSYYNNYILNHESAKWRETVRITDPDFPKPYIYKNNPMYSYVNNNLYATSISVVDRDSFEIDINIHIKQLKTLRHLLDITVICYLVGEGNYAYVKSSKYEEKCKGQLSFDDIKIDLDFLFTDYKDCELIQGICIRYD